MEVFVDPVHGHNVLVGAADLRASKDLCDVVLEVSGRQFPAHRLVLAVTSPYFRAMFTGASFVESSMHTVPLRIPEITPDALAIVLDFIYSGKLALSMESAVPVLVCSSVLCVEGAQRLACEFLMRLMDESSALGILTLADMHGHRALSQYAKAYTLRKFRSIPRQDFAQVPEHLLIDLLRADELCATSEEYILECAIGWLMADWEVRSASVPAVLACIRTARLINAHIDVSQYPPPLAEGVSALLAETSKGPAAIEETRARGQPTLMIFGGNLEIPSTTTLVDLADCSVRLRGAALLRPRRFAACTTSPAGHVYALGGLSCEMDGAGASMNVETDTVERFDPISATWSYLSPLPVALTGHQAAWLNGCLYVSGGKCLGTSTSRCFRYHPCRDEWEEIAPLCVPRRFHAMVAACGRLYVFGGRAEGPSLQTVEVFDPDAGTWGPGLPMPHARSYVGACVLDDGLIYVLGGEDSNWRQLSTVDKYDPVADRWSTSVPMLTARSFMTVAGVGKRIFLFGGNQHGHDASLLERVNRIMSYDAQAEKWAFVGEEIVKHPYGACSAAFRS